MPALSTCPELSPEGCARRLARLREAVRGLGAGAAILHEPDVIRWAIGATSPHGWPAALVVTPDEAVALLFGQSEPASIASRLVMMRGIRRDRAVRHNAELAAAAAPWLAALRGRPVAIDRFGAPGWIVAGLAAEGAAIVDVAPELIRLRRRKDPDELAVIAHNVAIADLALGAAGAAIRSGVTELDVYHAMIDAVEGAAGTSVDFGGDFMAGPGGGETGGRPTMRVLEAGDAYVVDYFPFRGGYWGDMCRTYPIGDPSPRLRDALRVTSAALDLAETIVRPGVPVVELDRALRAHQSAWDARAGDYFHLTGHGIGLRPHEAPWIATDGDEVFAVGDVLAIEPAVYADDLRGGVRIEDNYVVEAHGLRRLSQLDRGVVG
jgi:Xaa-Pro aminopeptidase